jgi:hypothetical protein
MKCSFDWVDEKLCEADYFLTKMSENGSSPEIVRYNFSAFVSAGRSVTFALQAVKNHVNGLMQWYDERIEKMKIDPLSRFFITARNDVQKSGLNPVYSFQAPNSTLLRITDYNLIYFFDDPPEGLPDLSVYEACLRYMQELAALVHDAYLKFGPEIDPQQYYTLEHLVRIGQNIEDVLEDVMGIEKGSIEVNDVDEILKQVRSQMPTPNIDHIFIKYLGMDRLGNSIHEISSNTGVHLTDSAVRQTKNSCE